MLSLLVLCALPAAVRGEQERRLPAQALLGQGRFQQAAALFRERLERDPNDAQAALGLGRSLAGRGKCSEALSLLEPLVAHPGYGVSEALAVARCHGALGSWAQAAYHLDDALLFRPDGEQLLVNALALAVENGDQERFEAWWERWLQTGPEREQVLALEAWQALHQGDLEQVWGSLWLLEQLDYSGPRVVLTTGRAWLALDDPIAALELLDGSVLQHKFRFDAVAWLVEARRRAGRLALASAGLETRRRQVADNLLLDIMQVRVLADLGQPGALQRAQALLSNHPEHPEVLASAWYTASLQGSPELAAELASAYSRQAGAAALSLELLVPIDRR